jgi:L-rhamnose mutarotase
MEKIAFVMKLRLGNEAEYEKRHDEIWPELAETLKLRAYPIIQFFWKEAPANCLGC